MRGSIKEQSSSRKLERSFFTAIDICYIAVFTAIIAVMAQISVPLPGGVPMTLQTLAVPLAAMILGTKRGTASVVVYLLLGAAGAPVFSGLAGGVGKLFGMTGGFLFSFPLMAIAAGIGVELSRRRAGDTEITRNAIIRSIPMWLGLVIGAVLNYAVGTVWFIVVAKSNLATALTACVVPFIPTAILKIVLVGFFGTMLRRVLIKANLLE